MKTDDNDLLTGAASLDEMAEEAKIFITQVEADLEIEWRLRRSTTGLSDFVVFHPNGEVPGCSRQALIILGHEHTLSVSGSSGVTKFQLKNMPHVIGSVNQKLFLVCSEHSVQKLRSAVIEYLAFERVDRIYDLELELQRKLELRCRKEEASRLVSNTMAEAWSVAVNFMDTGVEYLILDQSEVEANLSLQINNRILPRLKMEGWIRNIFGITGSGRK